MRVFFILGLVLLPFAAAAQTEDSDRGFIQGLLEDALSAPGRSVRLTGFAGALSSRATIEEITVTDPDGVWFTATDVALSWNRGALLRGAIQIDEISVSEITLPRRPLPAESETPSPEASAAFALPDLPVSVDIAEMRIDKAVLGATVIGAAAEISFEGSAQLAGGAGQATLAIERLDQPGRFDLEGAYDNATRELALTLDLQEPENGLAVTLLGLPGQPSMELTVTGEDPISDFEATVHMATDGQDRLSGTVTLLSDDAGTNSFALNLGGDIAPVFVPEFAEFLGDAVALEARGARTSDGALSLDDLRLQAAALMVEGTARIGADGWPQSLALDAAITPPQGETVILPLPGGDTSVRSVTLKAGFDAEAGDAWTVTGRAVGFDQPGFAIDTLGFEGAGEIARSAGSVSGDLTLDASGIAPQDAALAGAIGERLTGALDFGWTQGAPLRLREVDLAGEDYGLAGTVQISGLDGDDTLTVVPDLALSAEDLGRFADLAGLGLGGAAELAISGRVAPLTGQLALAFNGTTHDLATGILPADRLLDGEGRLNIELTRDETGLFAAPLLVETAHARINGTAALRTGASEIDVTARVEELSRALPGLIGPAEITAKASQDGTAWNIDAEAALPGETRADFDGSITGDGRDNLRIAGALSAAIGQLQSYATLAGRDLSGAAEITLTGSGDPLARIFDIAAQGHLEDPRFGVPQAEALLRGTTRFDLSGARDAAGNVTIRRAEVDGQDITADLSGAFGPETGALTFDATVANLGPALPQLPGAARLSGTANRSGQTWEIDTSADLPGETGASYRGTLTVDGSDSLLADGRLEANVARLSAFAALAGRPLAGAVNLVATGQVDLLQATFDLAANGAVTNPAFGVPTVEPLLRGTSRFDIDAARNDAGQVSLRNVVFDGPGLDAGLSGSFGPSSGSLSYQVSVANVGLLVPDLRGPGRVTGTAERQGNAFVIDAAGQGPGGIELAARGRVTADASRLDLTTSGLVPLALGNRFLQGRAVSGLMRFDLAVNGPPALSSLSGRVSLSDARLSDPAQNIALTGITGGADLAGARAQLGLSANISSGGQVRISGPVSLEPPYTADLVADLVNVILRDATLYEARLGGRLTVTGPLTGGARLGGAIDLASVELRIPDFGPSYSALDGLRHVAPPADVQRTLRFAGLDEAEETGGEMPDYPLDLTVSAPNQVFVRGRGLDAELGGTLRLTGSTNNIVPVGSFSLIRGRLDLLGRRLTLTRGEVQLRGSFDPVIDFEATTQVEDTSISLQLEGVASSPELTVSSVPDLPQDEALSFFLFGRDAASISPLQALRLAAAIRTLSGQGGLGLQSQLREGLGAADLDIGTDADGNTEASVGTYISDNIYTDVTVNSAGSSQVNINLDLTDEITVRGRVGSDGDTGVGIFFERDY